MKRIITVVITVVITLVFFSTSVFADWTLTASKVSRKLNSIKWKVVCVSDGSALPATDLMSINGMNDELSKYIKGRLLTALKVSPGTGGVVPNGTLDITLKDDEGDNVWTKTGIVQTDATPFSLYYPATVTVIEHIEVFDSLSLTMNDIGDAGDTVTLYFISSTRIMGF